MNLRRRIVDAEGPVNSITTLKHLSIYFALRDAAKAAQIGC